MSDRENILSALREKPLKVYEIMRRAMQQKCLFFVNEGQMCNLYLITMNQAAIRDQFKVVCTIPLAR